MSKSVEIILSITEFFSMLSGGFFLALIFDVFRSMRKAVRKNNGRNLIAFVYLQDILFLLFSFVFLVLLVYRVNGGKVDWYISLGCVSGAVIYYYLAEPIAGKFIFAMFFVMIKIFKNIIRFIVKIVSKMKKIIKLKKKDEKFSENTQKSIKKASIT